MKNKIQHLTKTLAISLVLAGCANPSESATSPSPSLPSASASTIESPSVAVSTPAPAPSLSSWACAGFVDNTATPVPTFSETDVVYYMFACDDNRVIVRVNDGIGHVVHLPLQSEYSFGQIDFSSGSPIETITFTKSDVIATVSDFVGPAFDLRAVNMARVVGPTTDIADFYQQDCLDYQQMYGSDDCSDMGEGSTKFFVEGDKNDWVNEYPN